MEEDKKEGLPAQTQELVQEDGATQHELHRHARSRLVIGIGSILLIVLFFFIIWPKWGEDIKEVCLGDGEVCELSIPGIDEQL